MEPYIHSVAIGGKDVGWDYVTNTGIDRSRYTLVYNATGRFDREVNVPCLTMLLGESDLMETTTIMPHYHHKEPLPPAYTSAAFATTRMGADIFVSASGDFTVSHASSLEQLRLIVNRLYAIIVRTTAATENRQASPLL
jgi:hypothetical protein